MNHKRRKAGAVAVDLHAHGEKRRKTSDNIDDSKWIAEFGLKLIDSIKQATDDEGRSIATSFLHLPSRRQNSGYYKTRSPLIALDTVEDKLKRHQYLSTDELRSDLQRIVSNAKQYNPRSSPIFADAERIRKIITDDVAGFRSAHKNSKYVTPQSDGDPGEQHLDAGNKSQLRAFTTSPRQSPSQADALTPSSAPLVDEEDHLEASFVGDSLQDAQEKLIMELIRLRDSSGREVSLPFRSKPDRNVYRHYYEIIQYPVSLRSIQKKVRGTHSKKNSSRMPAFRTWQAFEEEVSYLWRNAREFNEDGSEIFELAGVLEKYFKRRVTEAKEVVGDPEPDDVGTPRIKLKMGIRTPEPPQQKLTIRLPGHKPEDKSQQGVSVDGQASQRQQEVAIARPMGEEMDIRDSERPPASLNSGITAVIQPVSILDTVEGNQDALIASSKDFPTEAASLFPSSELSRIASEDALPSLHEKSSSHSALTAPKSLESSQPPQRVSPLDSLWRKPGRGPDSALILAVQIFTHRVVNTERSFRLVITPSSTASQQTFTINLPSSCDFIAVTPNVAAGTLQRQVKLVAFLGMQKLQSSSSNLLNPTYDIKLNAGVTKVDLEAIAAPAQGAPKSGDPCLDIDYERITIFFNLMR